MAAAAQGLAPTQPASLTVGPRQGCLRVAWPGAEAAGRRASGSVDRMDVQYWLTGALGSFLGFGSLAALSGMASRLRCSAPLQALGEE